MDTVSKIVVVICALIINFVIYYCFQEVIDFEQETQSYQTVAATYQGDHERICDPDGCSYKYFYNYPANGRNFQIIYKAKASKEPPMGSVKLVKYDNEKPTIAFFTKLNVLYLFYLIEFALLFVVLWVCFSRQKKMTVMIDGNQVQVSKPGPPLYFGQAIVGSIFTFTCLLFYYNLANTVKTVNPLKIISLTYPAGLVLIALLILGIFMTFWSYNRR